MAPPDPKLGGTPGTGIVVDASAALAKLKEVQVAIEPRVVLDTIGQRLLNFTTLSIKGAKVDNATPWQRMADSTLERRRRVYGHLGVSEHHFASRYQTLLQQSVVSDTIVAQQAVTVGTEAKYAIYHHHGASRGRWRLPARPLSPSPSKAKELAMAVVDAMVATVRARGGGAQ